MREAKMPRARGFLPPLGSDQELAEWQHSFADKISEDEKLAGIPWDLRAWACAYLLMQVEGVKSGHTLRAQRADLQGFLSWFEEYHGTRDPSLWLPRTTTRFLEGLEARGQKPSTASRKLTTVRSFARWVHAKRPELFPLGNPTRGARPPVQEPLQPKALNDRDVKRVLDAAFHLICAA